MPKKIDEELIARAVRLVNEHLAEYPSVTAASAAVAKQIGGGKESVRRWVVQSQVGGGHRHGVTTKKAVESGSVRSLREPLALGLGGQDVPG